MIVGWSPVDRKRPPTLAPGGQPTTQLAQRDSHVISPEPHPIGVPNKTLDGS
jgi:hypothetical protein